MRSNAMSLVPELGRKFLPTRRRDDRDPVTSLRRRVDSIFDEFARDFSLGLETPFKGLAEGYMPRVDVTENDKEIIVSAELPGMDEKNVNVSVAKDTLIIEGEKKEEQEEKGKNSYSLERTWGSFSRAIPIPMEVDANKIDATFKKGVLTVKLPKTRESLSESRHIKVKSE